MPSNQLTRPPFPAWPSMPVEFVSWFERAWINLLGTIAAIEGNSTSITGLTSGLDLTNTNLGTLQAQANALTSAEAADAAAITALQARATTDEGHITTNTAAIATINGKLAAGASGTITLPKLTGGGTNGSITVTSGLITAFTNPT